jgi:hypothetical protein
MEKDKSSEDLRRYQMCTRKKTFTIEHAANKAAPQINGRSYECPYCFTWHITTKKIKSTVAQ